MKIIEKIDRYLKESKVSPESPQFKKSESTKQTKEYVKKKLSAQNGTLILDVFYGDKVGPATFVFKDGNLEKVKPHKGNKLGKVVFATKD